MPRSHSERTLVTLSLSGSIELNMLEISLSCTTDSLPVRLRNEARQDLSYHPHNVIFGDFLSWFSWQGLSGYPLYPFEKGGSASWGPANFLKGNSFCLEYCCVVPFSLKIGRLPTLPVKFCILSEMSYELFV